MRNLKKLFAVLLAVAMIASMMVPALAGSYEAEGIKLQTIGLVAGDSPEQLDLDREMKRIEAVAFVIRAAGKEKEALSMTDEEVDEILADWKDAADLPSWPNDNARRYAAYAIKAGIVKGVSATEKIFAPNALVKGIDFLVLLLKSAFGFADVQNVDPTADNYVVDVALDAGILSATMVVYYTSKAALIRDDAIYILYNAAMDGVNADGDKLIDALIEAGAVDAAKAAEAGFVEGLSSVTAAAVGAKKIKVTFNTAVADTSKVTIEIKRGMVKPNVKSVTWAEDKKSAVVEFTSDLVTDNYTVTVTGAAEEALTYSFAVEAAKLVSITFDSDYAVKDKNDLKLSVTALNQYGEKVNISGATVTSNKGVAGPPVGTPSIDKDGNIVIHGSSGTSNEFKVDEKILIVVVKDNVHATASLTIAAAAMVDSIEFGTIQTSKDSLKGKDIRVSYLKNDGDTYYIPVTIKDQYGNVLKASQLGSVQILVSPSKVIKVKSTIQKKDNNDDNTVIKFEKSDSDFIAGTAVITLVAPSTGKTASTTVVVSADSKIDVVSVSSPEGDLKQGVATKLPVELTDTYGDAVNLFSLNLTDGDNYDKIDLGADGASISVVGGKLEVKNDYVNSTTTIKVKPGASATSLTIIATSATGKTQSLVFSVLEAPKAVAIKGMKSDFVSMLANHPSCVTNLKGAVEFLDQYGDVMKEEVTYATTATTASGIYYTVTALSTPEATTANITSSDAIVTAKAVSEKKSDKYKITLKGTGLSEDPTLEVEITVIPIKDIAEFEVKDIGKIYSGAQALAGSTYSKELKVVGKVDGKEVAIPQKIVGAGNIGIQSIDSSKDGIEFITTGDAIKSNIAAKVPSKDGGDETGKVKVLIVTSKTVKILEKEFVFSSAKPAVSSIEIKKGKDTVSGAVSLTKAQLASLDLTNSSSPLRFVAKDQYGVETSAGFSFFITNNDAGVQISGSTITKGSSLETGKSFVINAVNNGILQSIKVIVGQ